jgi:hypothetical protein
LTRIIGWDFEKDGTHENVIVREDLARNILKGLGDYSDLDETETRKPLIDEQIWTFLFVYGYRNDRKKLFEVLTGAETPERCEAWLEMLPLPPRKGKKGLSERNSNIDLIAGSIARRDKTGSGVQYRPGGPVCLVEAKWKSDIAGYTRHDPQRNQLARVIETAVTLQYHAKGSKDEGLPKPDPGGRADRFPGDVYVTLLTPRAFKVEGPPASRFYAYKYFEYTGPAGKAAMKAEVESPVAIRREGDGWLYPNIEQRLEKVRLRWVTFEDLYREMPKDNYKKALGRFIQAQPESSVLDLDTFPWENT